MNLQELIPEKAAIIKTIKGENEERTVTLNLREFDLEDESWLKVAFGDKLQSYFENMDMDVISRIAFHQLEMESKREVMKLKFMDMDENGEESEVAKTGPQKIRKITVGYPDQFELLTCLLKTRGFSMPIIEELSDHIDAEAKKLKGETTGKSKKARKVKSIGPKSLT